VLGPNVLFSGLLINDFVLNGKKRYYKKLEEMTRDGLYINSDHYLGFTP
jgi:hypothetical protein